MSGPDWSGVQYAFSRAAERVGAPDWAAVQSSYSYAADRAAMAAESAFSEVARLGLWAVAYKLTPVRDGDKWCVLLGDNLQSGIAGFGETPEAAIWDFECAMQSKESQ